MYLAATTYALGLTKHQLAGIVLVVAAVAIIGWAAFRMAIKAAKASLLLVVGVIVVVVAVLLFARVI
jgi:hypothetical protein